MTIHAVITRPDAGADFARLSQALDRTIAQLESIETEIRRKAQGHEGRARALLVAELRTQRSAEVAALCSDGQRQQRALDALAASAGFQGAGQRVEAPCHPCAPGGRAAVCGFDTTGAVVVDGRPLRWADIDGFAQEYLRAYFASLPGVFVAVPADAEGRGQQWGYKLGALGWIEGGFASADAALSAAIRRLRFDMLRQDALARALSECDAFRADPLIRAFDRARGNRFWELRQSGALPSYPALDTIGDRGRLYMRGRA